MELAFTAAKRSTCTRRQVGCVLVLDKHILATGYNGSLKGAKHCSDVGCLIQDGVCARTVHAEINAICQAAKSGAAIKKAQCYVTCKPCYNCFKALANAGIEEVYYQQEYHTAYPESYYLPRLEKI